MSGEPSNFNARAMAGWLASRGRPHAKRQPPGPRPTLAELQRSPLLDLVRGPGHSHALAPTCANCGIHIIGHGLEKEGTFSAASTAPGAKGVTGLRDRVGAGGVIEMGSGT
jgi:hypothetical protein